MWELINRTPYAAQRCFIRDMHGAEVWIVAVKGTFIIQSDGKTVVAEAQEPVTLVPRYWGDPGQSSLRYESDIVLTKPGTDLLVHGSACAPGGKPALRVDVGIRWGSIEKRLSVFGERVWQRGLFGPSLSEPEPFTRMPLRYERAFGGIDPEGDGTRREARNPVGKGFREQAERLIGSLAPNIEHPTELISSWKQRPPPAGFGPIPRDWMPRAGWAGTYDQHWEEERMPLLPLDLDPRFFYAAPADQQVSGHAREGTTIELLNLTREGFLRFTLPRTRPVFRTFIGGKAVEHRPRLHAVIVEPDLSRVILVWQTALRCQGKEHSLEKTIIREKAYV